MKVLVVSVHPDDETLGCGGTLLKHRKQGDQLFWMIITKPDESTGFCKEFIKERKNQIKAVSNIYGFEAVHELEFNTTKLHAIDFSTLMKSISQVINEVKPEIIYMNNRSDIHTDHQVAAKALISCTKSFRYPFIKKILMYECISETEIAPSFPENIFIPNVFSDITDFIEQKIEIMKLYRSEIQETPLPRSIENIRALARYRGASCGVDYAEAFMLVRERF
ncbi:PIG-L deacetylase family protein [Caldicellulosiruptor acetigenus]|uniref:PIG-L deacetylase family protein n=1 Tax=Caldicellulosiruptor acetigenus TaxID=301953 RepID=UPI0003F64E98|nr:PIG-L family deacetylase [Caldicellulosiruptor acetigenus]WAM37246.1 PIG-L family deacetylase [Caldicellulosiruptor acetigenus]